MQSMSRRTRLWLKVKRRYQRWYKDNVFYQRNFQHPGTGQIKPHYSKWQAEDDARGGHDRWWNT